MMMAQKVPIKLSFTRTVLPIKVDPHKTVVVTTKNKVEIDDAYKDFFAALFKIKDRDVQRRVLQAVNDQNVTCATCANKIQSNESSAPNKSTNPTSSFSFATQTLARDFEFLEKINSSAKRAATMKSTNECHLFNKIQLGRARRKVEPYAKKTDNELDKSILPRKKASHLRYNYYEPNSLLDKARKPFIKVEPPPIQKITENYSITEKLLLDNLDGDQSMPPHGFFNFVSNEQPTKYNDFFLVSRMEEEMRTAGIPDEEGLFSIHKATITGDLFKLRRLMVIFKFNKWDVNIRSEDEKKETPLHFAMACTKNDRNNDIINLLYKNGADVMATNDVGDTVLHLAAETIVDFGVITRLLNSSKISLDDLAKQNDKGQTILHVAVTNKNRLFVKAILNFIDEALSISSIGKDVPFVADNFQELDTVHLNFVKTFIDEDFQKPPLNATKMRILNQQDGRMGKTAAFLALENNDQSTCLMLLAHFVDTRIEDFSNTSCEFYSTEVLKNRILSQAIYYADSMHNAVGFKTLKQTVRYRSSEGRKRVILDEEDRDDGGDIMSKVAKVFS